VKIRTFADLQIFDKNAFGGRAPPGPAGGAIALPRPLSRYEREGRERSGKKGLGMGRRKKGKQRKGVKG